jgi:hypothetical protein
MPTVITVPAVFTVRDLVRRAHGERVGAETSESDATVVGDEGEESGAVPLGHD